MDGPAIALGGVEAWARTELDQRNAAREQALRESREMIRACALSIRAVHRREPALAEQHAQAALRLHEAMRARLEPFGDVYWAGYVQDAQKELVEALCTRALVEGRDLPDPCALGVAPGPYLNGLAEAVGELRRYILDQLRRDEIGDTERLLSCMDDIYSLLVTVDYPDALTGGLRRTTDSTRGILERTRGDLTVALRQELLRRALERSGSPDSQSRAAPGAIRAPGQG